MSMMNVFLFFYTFRSSHNLVTCRIIDAVHIIKTTSTVSMRRLKLDRGWENGDLIWTDAASLELMWSRLVPLGLIWFHIASLGVTFL